VVDDGAAIAADENGVDLGLQAEAPLKVRFGHLGF
jgi:hypothetical protein